MFLRAGLWVFAGKASHQLVRLALVVILARLLTPEAFGIVASAHIILALSEVVVRFGIGAALIQTNELPRRVERAAQTIMLALAAVMSGLLMLAAPAFGAVMQVPELVAIMPVMLASFMLSAFTSVPSNLISRDMSFRYLAKVDVLSFSVGYGAVSVVLALLGFSYWSLIIGTLAQSVLSTLLLLGRRPVWPTLDLRKAEIMPLLRFGGGVFLAQMASNVAQRADNIVVTSTMGPAALGYYSRAYGLMDLSNSLLGSVFREVLFSGFSKQRREGLEETDRAKTFLNAHAFAAFLILPISALMYLLAEEIVLILLGDQWVQAVPVLQVLALGMFFRLGYKVSGSLLLASGKIVLLALMSLLYALMVVAFTLIGARTGIEGIAWGVTVALACHHVLLLVIASDLRSSLVRRYMFAILPFAVAALIAVTLVLEISKFATQDARQGLLFAAGTTTCFLASYLVGSYFLLKIFGQVFLPSFDLASYVHRGKSRR